MSTENRSRRRRICFTTIAVSVFVAWLVDTRSAHAQTPVSAADYARLKANCVVANEPTANDATPEAIAGTLRAVPLGAVPAPPDGGTQGPAELFCAMRPTDGGFWYWNCGPAGRTYAARRIAELGSGPAATQSHVTECEFTFGVRSAAAHEIVEPYVLVSFYTLPPSGDVPAQLPDAPVSTLAYRFAPLDLPAAGTYVVRTGLLDLSAAGLDFTISRRFLVEILPLSWQEGEPGSDADVFPVFTDPGAAIIGRHLDVSGRPEGAGHWAGSGAGVRLRGLGYPNMLGLSVDDGDDFCVPPEHELTVILSQSNMTEAMRGFQTRLWFDDNQLTFKNGHYTAEPYGDWEIPITANGPNIDLTATIADGQPCSSDDADLVVLTFMTATEEGLAYILFDHTAPEMPSLFFRCTSGTFPPTFWYQGILIDGTDPEIHCVDEQVQCMADIPTPEEDIEDFFDDNPDNGWVDDGSAGYCPIEVTLSSEDVELNGAGCPGDVYVLRRVYLATDGAGNTAECTRRITVIDDTPPEIETDADDETVECDGLGNVQPFNDWLDNHGGGEATDNCSDVTWTDDYDESLWVADCGGAKHVEVAFTPWDACDNEGPATLATFWIADTTPPEWTQSPQDETAECDGAGNLQELSGWLDSHGGGAALDLCDDVAWEHDYDESHWVADCGGAKHVVVAFTPKDDCGNAAEPRQAMFWIVDTTPPTVDEPPADRTVECDGAGNLDEFDEWLNAPQASDTCSPPATWHNDYEPENWVADCGGAKHVTVTFWATDECGNGTEPMSATFWIVDTTPPVFDTEPTDQTVECDGAGNVQEFDDWLTTHAGAEASDVCSPPAEWHNDYDPSHWVADCGGAKHVTVAFWATDQCDNSTEPVSATFWIVDTTPPTLDTPASDATVECDGAGNPAEFGAWRDSHGGAAASDLCSEPVTWTDDYDSANWVTDCGGAKHVLVTFTPKDACGIGGESTSATFWIVDTTPPNIDTMPADCTVECDGNGNRAEFNAWLNSHGGGEASDLCSEPVTWQNDFAPANWVADCGGAKHVVVAFTPKDDCDNAAEPRQATFWIVDTTPPTVEPEATDGLAECDGAGNEQEFNDWRNSHGGAEASDVCSPPVTWTDNYESLQWIADCGGAKHITVSFTPWDQCGNDGSPTWATFWIVDTTPPTVDTAPVDRTVECNGDVNPAEFDEWLNAPQASDTCSPPAEWHNDFDPSHWVVDCGEAKHVLVTFWATDQCDNSAESLSATFTIEDTRPPTLECDDLYQANDPDVCSASVDLLALVEAHDDCDADPDVHFFIDDQPITSPHVFDVGTATVQAEAIDDCENASPTCTFTVEIGDEQPPVISGPERFTFPPEPPNDGAWLTPSVDFECGGGGEADCISAIDNCAEFLQPITYWLESSPGVFDVSLPRDLPHLFPQDVATLVKAVASDESRGTAELIFEVVIENERPVICCPGNAGCTGCDETWYPSGDYEQWRETWVDNWVDEYPNDPDECGAEVAFEAWACDDAPGVIIRYRIGFNEITSPHFFLVGTTTVTVEAFDSTGQPSVLPCTFQVTVRDTEAPEIVTCPEDVVVPQDPPGACEAQVFWPLPTATDNCSVTDWQTNHNPGEIFPVGSTPVIYRALDGAGNESEQCIFYVTVVDNVPPAFDVPGYPCPPVEATAEEPFDTINATPLPGQCGAYVTWTEPQATDDCELMGVSSTHSPGDWFEAGVTPVTYTAEDRAGNQTDCTFYVDVAPYTPLRVRVAMQVACAGEPNDTVDRCITFELWNCDEPNPQPEIYETMLTFVDSGDGTHTVAIAEALLPDAPCGAFNCITARDKLHTIRRTVDLAVEGDHYAAEFVGPANVLLGGNGNDDNYIDIRDYGILVCEMSHPHYDSDGDGVDDGNTPCGMWDPHAQPARYHADFSSNGCAWREDFEYVRVNFLVWSDVNCCQTFNMSAHWFDAPLESISVFDLQVLGLEELAIADLNGDGRLDRLDLEAFADGAGPLIIEDHPKGSTVPGD
ncbi:MAG: HYR domain-containing protein [Phycisphaerae bacterium]|jgi:hypothetical protein